MKHRYMLSGSKAGRGWRSSTYFVIVLIMIVFAVVVHEIEAVETAVHNDFCGRLINGSWPNTNNDKINC